MASADAPQIVFVDRETGELIDSSPFADHVDVDADTRPKDYAGCVRMHAALSRQQMDAARFMREAYRQLAEAEDEYRKIKAQAIAAARMEYPATVAVDIANGQPEVCRARTIYRAAEGLVKAADQIGYKTTKDRAAGEQIAAWSMRVAPDGQYEPELTQRRES